MTELYQLFQTLTITYFVIGIGVGGLAGMFFGWILGSANERKKTIK